MKLSRFLIPVRRSIPQLRMNFVQDQRWHSKGMLWLFIGALLSVGVITHYWITVHKISLMDAVVNAPAVSSDNTRTTQLSAEELEVVQHSFNQIALPWTTLFLAVEKIHSDNVRLLSIEPDANRRTVRLDAETTDVYEMLRYMRALSDQPGITDVILVNQEMREDEKDMSLRFTLTALWDLK